MSGETLPQVTLSALIMAVILIIIIIYCDANNKFVYPSKVIISSESAFCLAILRARSFASDLKKVKINCIIRANPTVYLKFP